MPAVTSATDVKVILKFIARYNTDAHRLLTKGGYALQLYTYAPVHGGPYMVVMEHVPGRMMFY